MGRREDNIKIVQDTYERVRDTRSLQLAVLNTWQKQLMISSESEIDEKKAVREKKARILFSPDSLQQQRF